MIKSIWENRYGLTVALFLGAIMWGLGYIGMTYRPLNDLTGNTSGDWSCIICKVWEK